MVGTTLSHYKVLEKIGEGGMGEVYRAEDTNLDREVAIKVLPEQFTQDPQRLARFEREAKLLASLNHPNIAAIHSFEHSDDIHFLVLELVPGETLQERVAKGPLPVEEALELCRQIAEGVEAAHEKGVIHRDLKPANVKVTPEGKVKILDFGLAKAFADETPVTDISQSPTLTQGMTQAGVILGTAAYMSPEQARGRQVDRRADVWAFGCVLYECLTGQRAFGGETITDVLGAIIHKEPDWKALPGATHWRIQELLRRCLTKDAHDRLRDIATVRIEVKLALYEPATVLPIGVPSVTQPPLWKWAIPWSITLMVGVVAGITIWTLTRPTPEPLTQFEITPPATAPLASFFGNELAISPDGERIVYQAATAGGTQLYVRPLDELIATPIAGTERAIGSLFFSPDGESVAFFTSDRKLKKVSLMEGTPITLLDTSTGGASGSWAEDTIVFSQGSGGRLDLYQISANGGEPESLAIPDIERGELQYYLPEILPGGKAVLFTIWLGGNSYQTAVLSLETGERKVLLEGGRDAHYALTGHLVYELFGTGTLMAVPFDLGRLEIAGDSVPILQGVRQAPNGLVDYAFSDGGTLTYVPAGGQSQENSLVWVNRDGTEHQVTAEKRDFTLPRVSPDGKRLAFAFYEDDGNRNVWIYDIERDSDRRLTFEGVDNAPMIWSSDGNSITFQSDRDGPNNIYQKPADGSGPAERLTTSQNTQTPTSWSPDGSVLVFQENFPETGRDIWILPMEGDRKPQLLISSPSNDCCARFSPDGQWLAYVSDETGQPHVYVSPYPEPNVKYLVSGQEGGGAPVWSPDGTELFYQSGAKMMVVSVETDPTFNTDRPQELFEGSYRISTTNPGFTQYYDISPDGQRFVMVKIEQQETGQINVVLNWFEELKRLVPTDN